MHVLPFHVEHWTQINLQPAQHWCLPWMGADTLAWLAEIDAYTVLVNDAPIAIAGLWEMWPGRAMAWSYLSESAGPHMVGLTRVVQRFLDVKPTRRVEAYVDAEFEAGHRWIKLLGFSCEGYLTAFKPDGGDQILYARIKNG